MSDDFQTTTYAKWILSGEHAVLRGKEALVFPIVSKKLKLIYNAQNLNLGADFEGEHGDGLHLLFWSVLEHGLRLLQRRLNQIQGKFLLINDIPIGVGLGASAALSVAVTRWFIDQGWLQGADEYQFAKSLEDLFHGRSSGLDIVGVSCASGMVFAQGRYEALHLDWQPIWTLSACGQQGLTAPCISKVQALWEQEPVYARSIDERMQFSVTQAKLALSKQTETSLSQLSESIHLAASCFQDWGLMNETMMGHIHHLKALGAIASKPTGSGGGGYVLSLWHSNPPDKLIAGSGDQIRI